MLLLDMRTLPATLLVLSGMALARVRYYTLDISSNLVAPDGFERSAVTVNGVTPGPVLIAAKGDTMIVNVTNSLSVRFCYERFGVAISDFSIICRIQICAAVPQFTGMALCENLFVLVIQE
jgi:Multicopper oxidase